MGKAFATGENDPTRVVRRRFEIPALKTPDDAENIRHFLLESCQLLALKTDSRKHRLEVRYDVTQTTCNKLLSVLEKNGYPVIDSWTSHMKIYGYNFIEDNMRANAKAPPPSCCNKPPK